MLLLLASAAALGACETTAGVGITPGGGGGAPTSSQRAELDIALEDELESLISALTLSAPGLPATFAAPAGCPTAGTSRDTDRDGIPDTLVLTFANPPCTVTPFRGGTFAITGSLKIQDTAATDTTSYRLTYTNLLWSATDTAGGSRTYTASRNGTRSRTATDSSVTLNSTMAILRTRPNLANTQISMTTSARFVVDTLDSLRVFGPLHAGKLTLAGTMTWQRSTENWTPTIATPSPLVYDPTCDTVPQRFSSGQVTLTGSIANANGTLSLTFTSCGKDPTTTWTPSP